MVVLVFLFSGFAFAQTNYQSPNYQIMNINLGEQPFLTARDVSPPSVVGPGPEVVEISPTSAKIKWLTDKQANSFVKFGTTSGSYQKEISDSSNYVTLHQVELFGLTPKTTYYYLVKSTDLWGNEGESTERSFRTILPIPTISNLKVTEISSNSAVITFDTDYFTTAVVEYLDTQTGEKNSTGGVGFAKKHEITLKNLANDRTYDFRVIVRDEEGNEKSSDYSSFKTQTDNTPPLIRTVNFETTPPFGKEKARVVVSWQTDEPSTSQVRFGEGAQGEDLPYQSPVDPTPVTNHLVTISGLKPQTAYRLVVVSSDLAANISVSEPYLVLTQRQRKTLLQIILDNLQEVFRPFVRIFRR